MENISVKILDILFDLCEGENYAILDQEDIVARIPGYEFEPDEISETLEALAVEGFIDLKYADNTEYCIAMRTKGRALIKQSREKFQRIMHDTHVANNDNVIDMNGSGVIDIPTDEPASPAPKRDPERRSKPRAATPQREERADDYLTPPAEDRYADQSAHYSDQGNRFGDSGNRLSDIDLYEKEKKETELQKRRELRTLLAALIGSAAGALIINLIMLVIIILIKF